MQATKITIKNKEGVEIEVNFNDEYYNIDAYKEFLKSIGHKASSLWLRTLCNRKELQVINIHSSSNKMIIAIVNNYDNFSRAIRIGDGREGKKRVVATKKKKEV